ncbi:MAG: FtsX-like permease family protein [Luteitalea sp.]|nr:FtsX-like permease family protein [Luteitalea sp.]
MSWLSRLANVLRASKVERDLDDELRFHIEARIDALVAKGVARQAAEAQVARQFGSRLRLREASRDVKIVAWLESLLKDVRFGLRVLRKDLVLTAAAVASLALAIGACIAAFSLIDALMLRPLPVSAPDRLVYLAYPTYEPDPPEGDWFNYPLFQRMREAGRQHVDLFGISSPNLRTAVFRDSGGQDEQVRAQFVSGNTFQQLGIAPALGRLLTPSDDVTPGAHAVAVLSHAFWMRRFGGDPSVIGRRFAFYDGQFEIIGVARAGFTGTEPGRSTDLWVPTMMWRAAAFGPPDGADWSWFRIFGRLKPGVRAEQLQAVLQATFTTFRQEWARTYRPDAPRDRIERYLETPLRVHSAANGPWSQLRRTFERPLWILAIVVALVLLIASSNVANLLIARAAAREREMSLRLSIGAGRGRLIQQVLVESALLASVACVLGLLIAAVVGPAIVNMLAPSTDPAYLDLRLNWRVLAFAGGIGLMTTVLFGLAPALRASSVATMGVLKGTGGRVSARLTLRPLLALQVGFSLVVLFVASLLLLSFLRLTRVHPGFSQDRVLLLSLDTGVIDDDEGKARVAALQLLDRVQQMPGVDGAALSEWALFEGAWWASEVRISGREPEAFAPSFLAISPGYLETMRMRLLEGRTFTVRDTEPDQPTTVIVNDAFARRFFNTTHVVGRSFGRPVGRRAATSPVVRDGLLPQEIVGVVADAKYGDLREPAPPTVYVPLRGFGTLHVRAASDDPLTLAPILQREIPRELPALRVTNVTLQSTLIANSILSERLLALLSGFFAIVGLLLAAIGLYGVLSYGVVQRTREIGIRVALGAQPGVIVRTVLAHISGVMVAGIVAGLGGGLFLARFVKTMLYEVQPLDALSLALPVCGLIVVAVLAAVPPARRAARVDPVVALRYE